MRANNLNRRGLILLGAVSLAPLVRAQTPTRGLQSLDDLSASLQALAAKVRPAVVQIFSTGYAAP